MQKLNIGEISELIDSLDGELVVLNRVRPHNKCEIRKSIKMTKVELKEFIAEAIEEEHQPGGGIEISIPSLNRVLVGHHDGIYWLE
ncbi:MAG: hypothetical protein VX595_13345 [Pseudomonadota bacterium]|nr:hypothetical protein [Pseudomonadota bacterium]